MVKKAKKARKAKRVKAVPDGYSTVTAHIVLDDCATAIEFYKNALGAKETARVPGPNGKMMHAEIRVGASRVMLSDEMPPMPGTPGTYKSPKSAGLSTGGLYLYVPDADAAFERAVRAGCTVRLPVADMFWGDRMGQVIDPFGHTWAFATRNKDVSAKELERAQQDFLKRMRQGGD